MPIERDNDYDFIPPRPQTGQQAHRKGMQCGECGAKFDYNTAYGYNCPNLNCPIKSEAR